MKFKGLILLYLCATVFLTASVAHGQSPQFNLLHTFGGVPSGTINSNADGASPVSGLILSGNTFFGTAYSGGSGGAGAIFRINTDGSGFTNLYNVNRTNRDPGNSLSRLILDGNRLYGAAAYGGNAGTGGIFALNTDGTGYTNLYEFSALNGGFPSSNYDGANPSGNLVLSGGTLFGATTHGGSNAHGTLFRLGTNGSNFSVMHTFGPDAGPNGTNSDGILPGGLFMAAGKLYGTAGSGIYGGGLVFSIETNSSNYSVLHYFNSFPGSFSGTNQDGAYPATELTFAGGCLYGITQFGGIYGRGTIFKINLGDSNFSTLYNFTDTNVFPTYFNPPQASSLTILANKIYGTTAYGGNSNGTVFSLNFDGSGFTNLYAFSATSPPGYVEEYLSTNSDGSVLTSPVIYSNGTLYGAAAYGGLNGSGTIYSLQVAPAIPSLAIIAASHQFAVSWPLTASNFMLQTSTNLFTTNWNSITSGVTILGDCNIFSNQISGPAAFFRLRSQ